MELNPDLTEPEVSVGLTEGGQHHWNLLRLSTNAFFLLLLVFPLAECPEPSVHQARSRREPWWNATGGCLYRGRNCAVSSCQLKAAPMDRWKTLRAVLGSINSCSASSIKHNAVERWVEKATICISFSTNGMNCDLSAKLDEGQHEIKLHHRSTSRKHRSIRLAISLCYRHWL